MRSLASVFVGVDNAIAAEAASRLKDQGIATTPTGAAGFAGLLALSREPGAFARLGLGLTSRVLIVVTEQALD